MYLKLLQHPVSNCVSASFLHVNDYNAGILCVNGKFKVNSEDIPEGMRTEIKPDLIQDRSNEILYQVEPEESG